MKTSVFNLDLVMQYQADAAKLSSFADDPKNPMRPLIAAIGMLGEAVELAELFADVYKAGVENNFATLFVPTGKVSKELGDCWWYAAEAHSAYDLCLHEAMPHDILNPWVDEVMAHLYEEDSPRAKAELYLYASTRLAADAKNFSEKIKKIASHGHPLSFEDLGELLDKFASGLVAFGQFFDMRPESVMTANMDKLRARFGEKFSAEKSINRRPGDD